MSVSDRTAEKTHPGGATKRGTIDITKHHQHLLAINLESHYNLFEYINYEQIVFCIIFLKGKIR